MLNRNNITREEFVKICTKIILKMRKNITVANQRAGYLKYHREIKENDYFEHMSDLSEQHQKEFGYSLFYQHELINHCQMMYCAEAAEYLAFEVLEALKENDVSAEVMILRSLTIDHCYCSVYIHLKDEKDLSLWEIDAWDPRIIDVTTRPDGTIKNEKELGYGSDAKVKYSISTKQFVYKKEDFLFDIPKPKEGPPLGDATPKRKIFQKHHTFIWKDCSVKKAIKKKKLSKKGKVHYLQKKSTWQ